MKIKNRRGWQKNLTISRWFFSYVCSTNHDFGAKLKLVQSFWSQSKMQGDTNKKKIVAEVEKSRKYVF
jgi:hypothetical protein